jgi:hypothetical protein
MPRDPDLPLHDELADEDDELGWDRDQHGRMVDHAAPAPKTVPYDPDADPFLDPDGCEQDLMGDCKRCGEGDCQAMAED